MRYWDTSALIPLLIDEPARARMQGLYDDDPQIVAWWGTSIEIVSAVARREREKLLAADEVNAALTAARALAAAWHEVVPSDSLRRTAERLLRVHPLRAADSQQLAAALVVARHDPNTLELVCLDERLSDAAVREGFRVIGA